MELDEAKKVLELDKRERADICAEEIETVLKKHRCEIDVGMLLKPNKNPAIQIQIIALG